jgi:tRNA pseudouridine55 synthase
MFGFINLHKPQGWTSHDCVAKVRRLLNTRKVGHGGTLDPLATGVLPIAVGKATRLLSYLPSRKIYRAKVRFGMQTSTDDLEGEVLQTRSADHLTLSDIEPYFAQFLGQVTQIPPQYSAIQKDGKRLYELARQGKVVEVPSRQVEIFSLAVLNWLPGEFPALDLVITCGEGTYIRAIARDLGHLLGVGGTLAALERQESGGMNLEQSVTLEQLAAHPTDLIPPEKALGYLPQISLDSLTAQRWCQGQKILLPPSAGQELAIASTLVPLIANLHEENDHYLGITEIVRLETLFYLSPKVVLI